MGAAMFSLCAVAFKHYETTNSSGLSRVSDWISDTCIADAKDIGGGT